VVTKGTHHIARGGSYRTPSFMVRGASRAPLFGEVRRADVGFRCAYDAR
jgi:formylglycine-generating enzyme required for sulfatase activity